MRGMRLLRAGRREPAPGIVEWLVEIEVDGGGERLRGLGAAFAPPDAVAHRDVAALVDRLASASPPAVPDAVPAGTDLPRALLCAVEGALVDALVSPATEDPRAVVVRRLLGEEPERHPRPRPRHLWLRPLVDPAGGQAIEALIDAWMPRYVAVPLRPGDDGAALEDLAARLDRRVEPYHLVVAAARPDDPGALAATWQELAGRRRLWRFTSSLLFTEGIGPAAADAPLPGPVRALRPLAAAAASGVEALVACGFLGLQLDASTGPLTALRLRRRLDAHARADGHGAPELALSGVPPLATPAFLQLLRTAWLADLDHVGLDGAGPVAARVAEAAALAGRWAGLVRLEEGACVPDVVLGRVEVTRLFTPLADLPWPEDMEPIAEV